MDTLYLQQALTADAGGQTYLDVFRPARRVTYLFNHLLGIRTEFRRTEGEELAAFGLDTPTSSSLPLTCRASDKLMTTTMCAGKRQGAQVSIPGAQVDFFFLNVGYSWNTSGMQVRSPGVLVSTPGVQVKYSRFAGRVLLKYLRYAGKKSGCAGKRPGVQVSVPGVQVYNPGVQAVSQVCL